jgi:hypothetical protein
VRLGGCSKSSISAFKGRCQVPPPPGLPHQKGACVAQVYVKAITVIMATDKTGSLKTYHPGDWVPVSKQRAIELLENGQAEMPEEAQVQRALTEDLSDCGIYLRDGSIRDVQAALGGLEVDVTEFSGALRLPYERTLIWHPRQPLQRKQIALGFARIEDTGNYASWEVAAMLRANELLASRVGNKEDQRKTRAAIGDLRIPVYESSAVWVRKTGDTELFVQIWDAEMQESKSEELAFLRALYQRRVLLCSLPAGWLGRWRR